ncbi:shikimate kinase [Candidatus Entotheonella serta]|nr:shikimate kinase [Candidatus Entotheonella serta]
MNVILTGMRGTGKSSIGSVLSERLAFCFVDTDEVIEALAGQRIADIVKQYGWTYFRDLERQAVSQVAMADRQVIAVGGGTLMDDVNTARLKAQGVVVLLLCEVPILQRRIRGEGNRPSLTGQDSAEAELAKVWETRRARYHAVADVTFDVSEETEDFTEDTIRKAAQVEALLQQHGFQITAN